MAEYVALSPGDPAPWFRQRSTGNPSYSFDTAAGRYIVLCFYATTNDVGGKTMLRILEEKRHLFDDSNVAFFGVSVDPNDLERGAIAEKIPGIRHFLDYDAKIARLYGSAPRSETEQGPLRRFWLVIDPRLYVRAVISAKGEDFGWQEVAAYLEDLPPVDTHAGPPIMAPVISLSRVLEPEFCADLVAYYEKNGGEESGFMREVDGRTTYATDFGHKRRSDCTIDDDAIRVQLQRRVQRRVVPAIQRIHQFDATRMERYIIGCYSAETQGHFRPHRDNTTKGTAHRRFAMSVNLNADFEGGELVFPEYGQTSYKPPPGGAIVFSCSMLHMVTPVTRGKRYAFLPFLYDEAAAALREKNNEYLDPTIAAYRK